MNKNNIFSYATKELSQDAFICYLCSYAYSGEAKDKALNECAKEMISMFSDYAFGEDEFELNDIGKQENNIDIILWLSSSNKEYLIIIEDKTHTSEHNHQLEKYREKNIQKYIEKKRIKDPIIKGVYYKTGFQGDYSNVVKAGYKIISRRDLLTLFKSYLPRTNNTIFHEYYDYWKEYDESGKQYKKLTIDKWSWINILSAFEDLQIYLKTKNIMTGYGYAANKNGGEWVLYPYSANEDIITIDGMRFHVYLQMRIIAGKISDEIKAPTTAAICLKITHKDIEEKQEKGKLFDKSEELIKAKSAREKLYYDHNHRYRSDLLSGFVKPRKISPGIYMTFAEYGIRPDNFVDLKQSFTDAYDRFQQIIKILRNEFL